MGYSIEYIQMEGEQVSITRIAESRGLGILPILFIFVEEG